MAKTIYDNAYYMRSNVISGIQDLDQCFLSCLVESIGGGEYFKDSFQGGGSQAMLLSIVLNDFEIASQIGILFLFMNIRCCLYCQTNLL